MNPSILVTPNSKKAGKLDSIIPTDETGDLDVVRATTATYVDADGLIKTAGINEPRFDYSNGNCPSILVEPQRTNLVPNSQTFDGWFLTISGGVSISSVNTSNPFGFESVSKIIPTTTFGKHLPYITAILSDLGRFWVIAKADGYNYLSLAEGGGINGSTIIFNLSNGTISGTASSYTPQIYPLGDGWYKCSINMTGTTASSKWIIVRNSNSTADYSGDGTSGILIAHKQLEVGSFDTSPIITSGSTVTRNADVISKSGISSLIGQSRGSLVYYFIKNSNNSIPTISLSNNGTNPRFYLFESGTNYIFFLQGASTILVSYQYSLSNFSTGLNKIGITYGAGSFKIYINGSLITSVPYTEQDLSFSKLNIGSSINNSVAGTSNNNIVLISKEILSESKMIQLTTL